MAEAEKECEMKSDDESSTEDIAEMIVLDLGHELSILGLMAANIGMNTVEPPIMDTLKSGQPPYNGHTAHSLPIVHTFLPPKKGQPLNNGQNARPQCVHYSEVPL